MYNVMRHRRSSTTLLLLLLFFPSLSQALQLSSGKHQNTLIELFTSQGCSSCPPAERWLSNLQDDPRLWQSLIPVAFHVDYWDYLGWRDPFASPANSERQRRYHDEGAISTVYTPGFVVNGREWRRWFGLARPPGRDRETGVLTLELNGEVITARFEPFGVVAGQLQLNIAVLGVGMETAVMRGENAGRMLPQDFVVLAFSQSSAEAGSWKTRLPTVAKPVGGRLAIAAWISKRDRLAPLQAVGGWLP